jgi:hypothetical protein
MAECEPHCGKPLVAGTSSPSPPEEFAADGSVTAVLVRAPQADVYQPTLSGNPTSLPAMADAIKLAQSEGSARIRTRAPTSDELRSLKLLHVAR